MSHSSIIKQNGMYLNKYKTTRTKSIEGARAGVRELEVKPRVLESRVSQN